VKQRKPVFYFDLSSPYSYLAAYRVNEVLPVAPVWEPVWIIPIVGASGREWRRPAEQVIAVQQEIEQRAIEYGMPAWQWPDRYLSARDLGVNADPVNTLGVMRLATLAHKSGVGEEFARRAYHLAFGAGHDLTDVDDEVIAAAAACGLDEAEARAAPGDPEIKGALKAATDAAVSRGAIGLPTIAVGDELYWGDDRLEDAAAAFAAAY
jgi:2-hydroxychromene-2-carboxylate isomerase